MTTIAAPFAPSTPRDLDDLLDTAHSGTLSSSEAIGIATDILTVGDETTMVTNTEARRPLLEREGINPTHTTPEPCPRCARRGVERWVGHHADWEVCHVPFIKRRGGFGKRSPLEWLAIGCRTCNADDPDWGVAH